MNDYRPLIDFVIRCDRVENLAPLVVPEDTPIVVGRVTYRIVYEVEIDRMVLMPETEWRRRYEMAWARLKALELDAKRATKGFRVSDTPKSARRPGDGWMGL